MVLWCLKLKVLLCFTADIYLRACRTPIIMLCLGPRYDIPLDRLTLTATHNSFSHDRDISTHANFEVMGGQATSYASK